MSKKETFGTVVSNKMEKTIIVAVAKQISHKKYGKIIMRTNKYCVHDEKNICQIGDLVQIQETRPMSKNKNWILTKLIHKK
uniref:Small ribosomal subunit protein uS17c n=1 Tax=Anotrichium furcellatum TaxID=41999 RepID=A0A4D6WNG6_9FLOR|nr:ribosomal protein S17 [Anotrichium furcellatum]